MFGRRQASPRMRPETSSAARTPRCATSNWAVRRSPAWKRPPRPSALQGAVRARAAADGRLRPDGGPARHLAGDRRGDRTPGRPAPAAADPAERTRCAPVAGGAGRGMSAPPARQPPRGGFHGAGLRQPGWSPAGPRRAACQTTPWSRACGDTGGARAPGGQQAARGQAVPVCRPSAGAVRSRSSRTSRESRAATVRPRSASAGCRNVLPGSIR